MREREDLGEGLGEGARIEGRPDEEQHGQERERKKEREGGGGRERERERQRDRGREREDQGGELRKGARIEGRPDEEQHRQIEGERERRHRVHGNLKCAAVPRRARI